MYRYLTMDMNMLPVSTGGDWGGAALGAFGGALIGSWFGDGFGGYGRGGYAGGAPASTVATLSAIDTNAIMGGIESVRGSIGQTRDAVYQTANQTALGLCNLGYQGSQDTASVINALNQGFSGLNTAMVTSGYETRLAGRDIQSQIASCCCDTQKTIIAEGQATRALIDKYAYESLQTQLCDAKAKIAAMEANAFTAKNNQEQTAIILGHLAAANRPATL